MNELPEIISDLQLEEFADAKQFISKDIRVRRGQTSPEGIHRSDVAMFWVTLHWNY